MNIKFAMYNERNANSNWMLKIIFIACTLLFSTYTFAQTEFEPPKLTCVRNSSGQIELNWQLPTTANPCFTGYEIYASIGNKNGPYSLNTTITNPLQTTTLLTIGSGQTVFFYMINRGSCANTATLTNKTSDTLDNNGLQPPIELKKVTIENNHVVLSWYPAQSPEVIAYLVSYDNNITFDTVYGRFNTSYIDLTNTPNNAISYKVSAFETCENGVGLNGQYQPNSISSKAMVLSHTNTQKCPPSISLSWNAYKFGNIDPISYEVQTNILNAGYTTKQTLNASAVSFILQNFPNKQRFCIRIKANLPGNDSSFSNEICLDSVDVIQQPVTDYIRNITIENGIVKIEYRKDTLATPIPTSRFPILYRGESNVSLGGTLDDRSTFENKYVYLFEDRGLDVNNNIFWYAVKLIDTCVNEHYSDTVSTLRLSLQQKSGNKADVYWKGFEISNITFQHFRLEKIVNGDTTVVGTYNRSESLYKDGMVFDYTLDSIEVCYRVTAVYTHNKDATPRETLESHSNIICVYPEPQAFIPQAFVPTGYNNTIKPFIIFGTKDNYSFQIYDRWYRLLFSTNDVNASWNGIDGKGENAPNDSYIYLLKFKGKNGKDYAQEGSILLLR